MARSAPADQGMATRPLLEMRWEDLLFAHWPVDPARIAARLPPGYEVDTYDDSGYLGVVPFVMADLWPTFVPSIPAVLSRSFGELNLRTYVVGPDGASGVYFFNLDADDWLSVRAARGLFRLPYYQAAMNVRRDDQQVRFESSRTHDGAPACEFAATYEPADAAHPSPPEVGSLEAWLIERYRFYTVDDGGRSYHGSIAHDPWAVVEAEARFERNGLFEANGFETPEPEPTCLYAPATDVRAGRIRRLDS